jgi:hypothetical protein
MLLTDHRLGLLAILHETSGNTVYIFIRGWWGNFMSGLVILQMS